MPIHWPCFLGLLQGFEGSGGVLFQCQRPGKTGSARAPRAAHHHAEQVNGPRHAFIGFGFSERAALESQPFGQTNIDPETAPTISDWHLLVSSKTALLLKPTEGMMRLILMLAWPISRCLWEGVSENMEKPRKASNNNSYWKMDRALQLGEFFFGFVFLIEKGCWVFSLGW